MKTILALTFMVGALSGAFAQGTLEFRVNLSGANEVPPNISPWVGDGSFTLNGGNLTFIVGMRGPIFFPTSAGIYGPASTEQNAGLQFDLGTYFVVLNPPPGYTGYVLSYSRTFDLNPQQISDLEAGLWYVNFISSAYPGGEIRGQILPVPEPSSLALLGMAGAAWLFWRKRDMVLCKPCFAPHS